MKLIIVESPNKIKKIKSFLSDDYLVAASVGHIRDLPKRELGVDVEKNFQPKYLITKDKKKVVDNLKFLSNKVGANNVYLATDDDREGEAIAYHICKVAKLDVTTTKRIIFREITKAAITKAIDNPKTVDMKLVSAQESRRVLDRLVGFKLSPLLSNKIVSDNFLSAGRVQSVALKLINDREQHIINFNPTSGAIIKASFNTKSNHRLSAKYLNANDLSYDELTKSLSNLFSLSYNIVGIDKTKNNQKALAPLTTSTLQQETHKKLKMSVQDTMDAAQKLFEAGHITYHRTDSTFLSDDAISDIHKYISSEFGDSMIKHNSFASAKSAQEAHEAIRPTSISTASINESDLLDQVYKLIHSRTIACQMADAQFEQTSIKIQDTSKEHTFISKASILTFSGWKKAYTEVDEDDSSDDNQELTDIVLHENDPLSPVSIVSSETLSKPKKRYTEAALVKELESKGIGRPSTYASIISTIVKKKYIETKNKIEGKQYQCKTTTIDSNGLSNSESSVMLGQSTKALTITPIGHTVATFLDNNFPDIINYTFTADCENMFDHIANGKDTYLNVLKSIYTPISSQIAKIDKAFPDVISPKRKQMISLGQYNNQEVKAGTGKHGTYILYSENFYSTDIALNLLTLEMAIKAINTPKKPSENLLGKIGVYSVYKGKYGPFITGGKLKKLLSLPKEYESSFDKLNVDIIENIIANYKSNPVTKKTKRKFSKKRKSTKK